LLHKGAARENVRSAASGLNGPPIVDRERPYSTIFASFLVTTRCRRLMSDAGDGSGALSASG
jgi:hypothetical protein